MLRMGKMLDATHLTGDQELLGDSDDHDQTVTPIVDMKLSVEILDYIAVAPVDSLRLLKGSSAVPNCRETPV